MPSLCASLHYWQGNKFVICTRDYKRLLAVIYLHSFIWHWFIGINTHEFFHMQCLMSLYRICQNLSLYFWSQSLGDPLSIKSSCCKALQKAGTMGNGRRKWMNVPASNGSCTQKTNRAITGMVLTLVWLVQRILMNLKKLESVISVPYWC